MRIKRSDLTAIEKHAKVHDTRQVYLKSQYCCHWFFRYMAYLSDAGGLTGLPYAGPDMTIVSVGWAGIPVVLSRRIFTWILQAAGTQEELSAGSRIR